jgi:hypothetical protein
MRFLRYFVFLFFALSHSQNNSKYSNEFMNIGVDASSISMSGAVTSSVDDVKFWILESCWINSN